MKNFSALLLALTLALPALVRAQAPSDVPSVRWAQISDQAVKNLESDIYTVRKQGMKNIICLAKLHGDEVALAAAVPSLIRIYEEAGWPGTKRLALAALESVKTDAARSYVQSHASAKQRDKSQALIASVLRKYERSVDTAVTAAAL